MNFNFSLHSYHSTLFFFSLKAVAQNEAPLPTVTLASGSYFPVETGAQFGSQSVYKFLSIPYAQPPIGSLRFAAPQPLTGKHASSSAIEAGSLPPACMQNDEKRYANQSEDCLYLNIYVPGRPTDGNDEAKPGLKKDLSTFFFLHGGGFQSGSASESYYDASALAASQNVIVVVPNYRLNVFGFRGYPIYDNYQDVGLLDQRQALQWVFDNIAKFGGNPKKVVVGGQSAGGRATGFLFDHLRADKSKQQPSGAIIQSGSLELAPLADFRTVGGIRNVLRQSSPRFYDPTDAYVDPSPEPMFPGDDILPNPPFYRLVEDLRCFPPGQIADNFEDLLLKCMRGVPASRIRDRVRELKMYFPVTDARGPGKPAGDFSFLNDTGLLIGNTAAEAANLVSKALRSGEINGTVPNYLNKNFGFFPRRQLAELKRRAAIAYNEQNFRNVGDAIIALETDMAYTCITSRIINETLASPSRSGNGSVHPVYRYQFNYTQPASHGSELAYVFGRLPAEKPSREARWMVETVQDVWGKFIRGEEVGWSRVQSGEVGVLGGRKGELVRSTAKGLALDDRCWVWNGMGLYGGRT